MFPTGTINATRLKNASFNLHINYFYNRGLINFFLILCFHKKMFLMIRIKFIISR